MTKALLEKDGVNWRQKLPPIPTVPVSAQTRWSIPSAQAPGANTPPATAPQGEQGGKVPSGWAESPAAPKGDEQESCHTCLVCLHPGPRPGETWPGSAAAFLVDAGSFDVSVSCLWYGDICFL